MEGLPSSNNNGEGGECIVGKIGLIAVLIVKEQFQEYGNCSFTIKYQGF